MRMDELEPYLTLRLNKLREREEFEAKPLPERLVILLKRGVKTHEKHALTGALVVETLLRWKAVQSAAPTEEAKRALGLLPEALGTRYSRYLKSKVLRRERYHASKLLVDALTHQYFHVRKTAIDSLKAMHGLDRGYDPNATEAQRKRAQWNWRLALKKSR